MHLLRILSASLCFASALAFTQDAAAQEVLDPDFTPRGFQIELTPSASFCLPSLLTDCKQEGIGSTKPFLGGEVFLGYRALRSLAVGVVYTGAVLRPDWDLPFIRYDRYAHLHGVFGSVRGILPYRRWDFGAQIGLGWSYLNFGLDAPDSRLFSQGFAVLVSPTIDVFLTPFFYLGLKADFIINAHRRVCLESLGEQTCEDREDTHQIPIHQALFGLHLGFVI